MEQVKTSSSGECAVSQISQILSLPKEIAGYSWHGVAWHGMINKSSLHCLKLSELNDSALLIA